MAKLRSFVYFVHRSKPRPRALGGGFEATQFASGYTTVPEDWEPSKVAEAIRQAHNAPLAHVTMWEVAPPVACYTMGHGQTEAVEEAIHVPPTAIITEEELSEEQANPNGHHGLIVERGDGGHGTFYLSPN